MFDILNNKNTRTKKMKQCINENKMLDYIMGSLHPEEEKQIKAHLLTCKNCHELYLLSKYLIKDSDSVNDDTDNQIDEQYMKSTFIKIMQRSGIAIKKIFHWITEVSPPIWMATLAPSKVRDSQSNKTPSICIKKDNEQIDLELYMEKKDSHQFSLWVKTDVKNNDGDYTLHVKRNQKKPFLRVIDSGIEYFKSLPNDTYHVNILKNDQEQIHVSIHVTENQVYEK